MSFQVSISPTMLVFTMVELSKFAFMECRLLFFPIFYRQYKLALNFEREIKLGWVKLQLSLVLFSLTQI